MRPFMLAVVVACHAGVCSGVEPLAEAVEAVTAVRAILPSGAVLQGSAVRVTPETVVTNCHVVAGAVRIRVLKNGRASRAELTQRSIERDICTLSTVERGVSVGLGAPRLGQRVFAVGFPANAALTVSEGTVVALHSYDSAEVIQTSAEFDYGASGGALFDERGRLVGILAFKARAGGRFHFALPVEWLSQSSAPTADSSPVAFWQAKSFELPPFLRAAALEAAASRKAP